MTCLLLSGFDPDRVIVDMAHARQARERLAAVNGLGRLHAAHEHDVLVVRVHANLAVVHRPLVLGADFRPRLALVGRAEHAARLRIARGPAALRHGRRLRRHRLRRARRHHHPHRVRPRAASRRPLPEAPAVPCRSPLQSARTPPSGWIATSRGRLRPIVPRGNPPPVILRHVLPPSVDWCIALPGPPPTKPHDVRRRSYVGRDQVVRVRRVNDEVRRARHQA